MMPDTRYAICRFDGRHGPIRVRADVPAAGWSLSIHAPNGDNFLFVPGTDERVTKLNILLKPPGTVFEGRSISVLQPERKSPQIELTRSEGLVVFKAPVSALSLRRLIDEQLGTFECFQEATRS